LYVFAFLASNLILLVSLCLVLYCDNFSLLSVSLSHIFFAIFLLCMASSQILLNHGFFTRRSLPIVSSATFLNYTLHIFPSFLYPFIFPPYWSGSYFSIYSWYVHFTNIGFIEFLNIKTPFRSYFLWTTYFLECNFQFTHH